MGAAQPLRSVRKIHAVAARSAQSFTLPIQLSSFVGRQREVAQLSDLLGVSRLLTLSGPGGVGKTRLALALAEGALDDYADGVWFVDLAALDQPALAANAFARVFGVEGPTEPTLIDTLADVLRHRSLLIIADNCEHVIEACAELIGTLLRGCPEVQFLATSREPLRVDGERVYVVPGLALPERREALDLERLSENEAVRLFVERATAARSDFRLTRQNANAVVEVCRRLDGLPLAIELAAAQARGLAPDQLVNRLGGHFRRLAVGARSAAPRQRTLQAAIDWSYELLDGEERILYRRLGVFNGGWTLESAEAVVVGNGVVQDEVLKGLLRLVDKSLLGVDPDAAGGMRYRMLEILRQDAFERLQARGEVELVAERHADYFSQLVERRAWPEPLDAAWLDNVEHEHDNVVLALGWLMERGSVDAAVRMGAALARFWVNRPGHSLQARAWLERLLALSVDQRTRGRLQMLNAFTSVALNLGDLTTGETRGMECLALATELGDETAASLSLLSLGSAARARGDYVRSQALHERGFLAGQAGKHQHSKSQTYSPRFAEEWELQNLWNLAWAEALDGKYAAAREHAAEAKTRAALIGNKRPLVGALRILGLVSYRLGESKTARSLLRQSLELFNALGAGGAWQIDILLDLGCVERDEGDVRQATIYLGQGLAVAERVGGAARLARTLDGIAGLAAAVGHPARAVRLSAAAERLHEASGCNPRRVYRYELERWLTPARIALGPEGTANARSDGRAMTPGEAVQDALGIQDAQDTDLPHHEHGKKRLQAALTRREQEVVALIARGLSNREIGHELVIAERTVEHHIENIFTKLGVGSRTQVAAWFLVER